MRTRKPLNASPLLAPLREPSNGRKDLPSTRRLKRRRSPEKEPPCHAENEALYYAENPCSRKRPRTSLQSDRSLPLTKHNLQKHNTLSMGSESHSSVGRGSCKRRASGTRTESVQSTSTRSRETASAGSQKSSGTSAHYRHAILRKAGIQIHHTPVPEKVRAQINAVIQREVSSERKAKLSVITQQLHKRFIQVVTVPVGEDDCVEPFYEAISSMEPSGRITFPRKADWRSDLKPCIRPYPSWVTAFASEIQHKTAESVGPPSKRQQVLTPSLSPDSSVPIIVDPVAISLEDKVRFISA